MASVLPSFGNISQPKGSSFTSRVDSDSSIRAAMIRNRFAETILRAQDKMIPSDLAEKEIRERNKAEVEAGIRDAQMKLKEQRQKERELARLAIEKIVQTVEWNHALELAREFDKLIGGTKVQTMPRNFNTNLAS
ncbi:hypothetical protein Pint_05832 [Pistacia integerrima]|uniref:Uncharacterized protein n=1 Tax=Pistacia integerrima TaxID=434235 RepID=A0ACC0Z5Y6_9ROSI|nr:hypothetical protein Pint_05832 [Pistacia integerrima]